MKIDKILIIFLIFILGIGIASASDDMNLCNNTNVLTVEDTNFNVDTLNNYEELSIESQGNIKEMPYDEEHSYLKNQLKDNSEMENQRNQNNTYFNQGNQDNTYPWDEEDIFFDQWDEDDTLFNQWNENNYNPFKEHSLTNNTDQEPYEIITSNITKYDFHDTYKVKVVDQNGNPITIGKINFYVNHELASTSNIDYGGYASFNLHTTINTPGTYNIISIYTSHEEEEDSLIAHQNIEVKEVPMDQRDIQIHFENIKLYDLGESYNIKITDKKGNPIKKGNVYFIIYDRILFSNITKEGIASCTLPLDLNFTGNLLVWTVYTDEEMYDLAASEAISIGTRTWISLDQNSIGSHMVSKFNKYNFTFKEGKHIAEIGNNTYLIIENNGNIYLLYESTIHNSTELMDQFKTLAEKNKYDLVKLNLINNITYTLDDDVYSDQEWDYASRFAYGQLIINGNGATIKGSHDINFMYIGSEANTNLYNLNISNFDHCFMNHGTLQCKNCTFTNNEAYKFDVKLWGSGTIIHNYNTIFFDECSFYDNNAQYYGLGKTHMDGSILYAEPYSLNIFKDISGTIYTDSFYCDSYTTTIIYDSDYKSVHKILSDSFISQNAYFSIVDDEIFSSNKTWVANISNIEQLKQVLWTLNTFINATEVIINMEPGEYVFDKDYGKLRGCNWRAKDYDHEMAIDLIQDRYLLDVGYCPITINGNGATISIKGNDKDQDYHFAYIGKYGSLTLNNLELKNFNTALMVTGNVFANQTTFKDNIIDYTTLDGDLGGAFRSLGGTVICHNCIFTGNKGDDDADDFYAESSSYIEFKNCSGPTGQMKDSYLKCSQTDKKNISLKGNSIYEETIETNNEEEYYKTFNINDNTSYSQLINYLKNHTASCIIINFTGNYNFTITQEFQRQMTIIFQNNGHNIQFNKLEIAKSTTMNFINFEFNNIIIKNKGTSSFTNCSFHNKNGGDQAIRNEGTLSLTNCSIYNNKCNNEIIYNLGTLAIYNSRFWNNSFDYDDKGLIHNNGRSVTCLNSTFNETKGCQIYNFATGNCAIIGYDNNLTKVKFDKPWSNFKTDMIKTAFIAGTAFLSFGAGYGIGVAAPTVLGFIGASIAGAGIGFTAGMLYGYLEGRAYHDYSNLWNNVLSFTYLGFSWGRLGWTSGSQIVKRILQPDNQNGADGGSVCRRLRRGS